MLNEAKICENKLLSKMFVTHFFVDRIPSFLHFYPLIVLLIVLF